MTEQSETPQRPLTPKEIFEAHFKEIANSILGETKLTILQIAENPCTINMVSLQLGISYQSVRKHFKVLEESKCLVKSIYVNAKGNMYMTNYDGVLEHCLRHPLGQQLARIHPELAPDTKPVTAITETHLTGLPAVTDTPVFKIHNQQASFWDLLLISGAPGSAYATLFYGGMLLISHAWYRSYLRNEVGIPENNLPAPNEDEIQATIKSISQQIHGFNKVLMELGSDGRFFNTPDAGNWKIIGGLPVTFMKEYSERLSTNWVAGNINVFGSAYNLAEEAGMRKAAMNADLAEKYKNRLAAFEEPPTDPENNS